MLAAHATLHVLLVASDATAERVARLLRPPRRGGRPAVTITRAPPRPHDVAGADVVVVEAEGTPTTWQRAIERFVAESPKVPVIAVAAEVDDTLRATAARAGAVASLSLDHVRGRDLASAIADARAAPVPSSLNGNGLGAALRASQRLVTEMMTHAPVGLVLTGSDGRIQQCNCAFTELTGRTESELVEHGWRALVHPDDWPAYEEQTRELHGGQSAVAPLELRLLHRTGRPVWVELTRHVVRDDAGRPAHTVAHVQNVTERRQARELSDFIAQASHVLASSLEHEQILHAIAHLTVPTLADWCIIDLVDPATNTVRRAATVAHDPPKEAILAELRDRFPAEARAADHPVSRVIQTGQASTMEQVTHEALAHLAGDEEQLRLLERLEPTSWMIVPLAARGRVIGAITFASSEPGRSFGATELRVGRQLAASAALAIDNARLYRESRSATQLRDDVLGFIAQDLRDPLAAISRWVARLADETYAGPERERTVAAIQQAADVMNGLVDQLLDIGQLEAGRMRLEREPIRAAALLEAARDAFEPLATARRLQLRAESVGAGRVHVDPQRLHQVFANLVGNALRFVAAGGSITLRAQPHGDAVLFSVADTGVGIAPDDLPHVFDRFWQATHAHRGGAGLGLAIARGIVEAHGGRMWMESRLGQGTTVYFTLPVWRGAATPTPTVSLESVPSPPHGPPLLRVLVVDDHPLTRTGLTHLLSEHPGVTVVGQAASGEDAIAVAAELRPDVVIMDLTMPGIGGVEATRRIVEQSDDTVVLVLTADEPVGTLADAIRAGARGYLRKSVRESELVSSLRAVARGELLIDPALKRFLRSAVGPDALQADAARLRRLTERERKVLALTAQGFTAAQTGDKLFLSPKTVETYRSRAMRKLGLATRTDLVAFAMRMGLLAR